MPTYQYACTECGHQLEAVQSFTDEPLTECPACEGRLRKLFNSVGIVFKGSGFYRTDSRSNGSESSTSSSTTTSTKSESTSSNGSSGTGSATGNGSGSTAAGSGSGSTAAKPAATSASTGA